MAKGVRRFDGRGIGTRSEQAVRLAVQAIRSVARAVSVIALIRPRLGRVGLADAGIPRADNRRDDGVGPAVDSPGATHCEIARTRGRAIRELVSICARRAVTGGLLLAPAVPASASFLSGEALDTAASAIAWFVIVVVPIAVIILFWLVHVLPEKIAEKRHHPQKSAIHVLCLLSLAFGGLLWPLAWLWAYTKPVAYRMAYGTDKHEDYYQEMADKAQGGDLLSEEIVHLRRELDAMAAKGTLPAQLQKLRGELDALNSAPTTAAEAGKR